MDFDRFSNSSDDILPSEVCNLYRSSSRSRHSEDEYDEDLQRHQYDQDEDTKDTELERSREGGRATSTVDEEGEITDENREKHSEKNSNNGKPSAVSPDPKLVNLAIEMMPAGQVNIPAKVYREYQKQKDVSLNCAGIFPDLFTNGAISQMRSYIATGTGPENPHCLTNDPRIPLRLPPIGRPPAEDSISKKNRGILLFLSLRHRLSTTFLEVSGKNRKKKVWFFFLIGKFPTKPVELGYDGGWEYIEISRPLNKTKLHHISTEKSQVVLRLVVTALARSATANVCRCDATCLKGLRLKNKSAGMRC